MWISRMCVYARLCKEILINNSIVHAETDGSALMLAPREIWERGDCVKSGLCKLINRTAETATDVRFPEMQATSSIMCR